jgi:hypothetical protein
MVGLLCRSAWGKLKPGEIGPVRDATAKAQDNPHTAMAEDMLAESLMGRRGCRQVAVVHKYAVCPSCPYQIVSDRFPRGYKHMKKFRVWAAG